MIIIESGNLSSTVVHFAIDFCLYFKAILSAKFSRDILLHDKHFALLLSLNKAQTRRFPLA